jgi:hypothetical protein
MRVKAFRLVEKADMFQACKGHINKSNNWSKILSESQSVTMPSFSKLETSSKIARLNLEPQGRLELDDRLSYV